MAFRWWPFSRKASGGSIGHPEQLWREIYGGRTSRAGMTVTAATALQTAVAFACVRVASEDVACLPFDLVRQHGGRREPLPDHPVARLLDVKANDWQAGLEFRETMQMHAELTGDGVAFVNRVRGVPAELVPILPSQRRIIPGERLGDPPKYEFQPKDGPAIPLPRENVLHLRGPSWSSVVGVSFVDTAREAIGLGMALESHAARLHANGARPSGVLTTEQALDKPKVDAIREAWDEAMSGPDNAFKTAVVTGGMKFIQMAMSGVDAQTLEQRRFQIEEVCRFFRVSPQMVWHTDKTATFASAEAFFLAHVKYTVLPRVRRWEAVIRRDLLGRDEAALRPKHNLGALERADIKTRYTAYGQSIKDGWRTRNEVRGLEDLDPLDGLDEVLTPLNMATGPDSTDPAADQPKGDA